MTYSDEDEEQEKRPKQLYDQLDLRRSSFHLTVRDELKCDDDANDDAGGLPCSSCGR